MGCKGCNSPKNIKAREKRKREIKYFLERRKNNLKRKTCWHCPNLIKNNNDTNKECKITHKSLDFILKTKYFTCPLGYF